MKNIIVLVSGGGTNLEQILKCIETGEISGARVSRVIADRDCYALKRAEKWGIESFIVPRGEELSERVSELIPEKTDLIVLAGFLSILSKEFCERFERRIINLHPSLLPRHGGAGMWGPKVHRSVLESGDKESGASVHYVSPEVDLGEVILQEAFALEQGETPESLAEKVHAVEYRIFPLAIQKVLNQERK
ncbi:phosphoribosylglycinamide formyltransferase [Chryseobacterium sp. A301]